MSSRVLSVAARSLQANVMRPAAAVRVAHAAASKRCPPAAPFAGVEVGRGFHRSVQVRHGAYEWQDPKSEDEVYVVVRPCPT